MINVDIIILCFRYVIFFFERQRFLSFIPYKNGTKMLTVKLIKGILLKPKN